MRNFSFLGPSGSTRARSSSMKARTSTSPTRTMSPSNSSSQKSPQVQTSFHSEDHRLSVSSNSSTNSSGHSSVVETPVNDNSLTSNGFFNNGQSKNSAQPPMALMIWDWDDTLLPSAWCSKNKLTLEDCRPVRADLARHLKRVATEVRRTLQMCKAIPGARMVIITNAEEKWVQLSCAKFMPSLEDIIGSTQVVSARSKFESTAGMCPTSWKEMAFREAIYGFLEQREDFEIKNFVKLPNCSIFSFGDSQFEREALRITTADLPSVYSKCVRFFEKPTPDQICKQHVLVRESMKDLLSKQGNLDLVVQVDDSVASPAGK